MTNGWWLIADGWLLMADGWWPAPWHCLPSPCHTALPGERGWTVVIDPWLWVMSMEECAAVMMMRDVSPGQDPPSVVYIGCLSGDGHLWGKTVGMNEVYLPPSTVQSGLPPVYINMPQVLYPWLLQLIGQIKHYLSSLCKPHQSSVHLSRWGGANLPSECVGPLTLSVLLRGERNIFQQPHGNNILYFLIGKDTPCQREGG